MKNLLLILFLAIIAIASCSNPTVQENNKTINIDPPMQHPDSMEVCCDGKCKMVSYAIYQELGLVSHTKACRYLEYGQ